MRAVAEPRPDAKVETIASDVAAAPTVARGHAGSFPGGDGPAEVSPEHYRVEGEFARGGFEVEVLSRGFHLRDGA